LRGAERDEAIQDGISDWIASLALAMTSRSRDASQHPSYATPFPETVTTGLGLDPVVHADVVLAKRRWKRFASDA
jgi:hypothetical protein